MTDTTTTTIPENVRDLVARMTRGETLTDEQLATVRAAVDPEPVGAIAVIARALRDLDTDTTIDGPTLPLDDYLEDARDLAAALLDDLRDAVRRLHHPTRLDGEVWVKEDDVIDLLTEELTP